jgi:hypothetical protein
LILPLYRKSRRSCDFVLVLLLCPLVVAFALAFALALAFAFLVVIPEGDLLLSLPSSRAASPSVILSKAKNPRILAGWSKSDRITTRVPHLRDGFIVDKVGNFRGSENPDPLKLTHAVMTQNDTKEKATTTSSPSLNLS